jgi:hypothetical protein
MKREDFIFTIGYQGNTAVVDGRAKKQYGSLSTRDLAEKGFYKAAFSSALYSGDEKEVDEFLAVYNSASVGGPRYTKTGLGRLFGVYGVPEGINRIKIIQ